MNRNLESIHVPFGVIKYGLRENMEVSPKWGYPGYSTNHPNYTILVLKPMVLGVPHFMSRFQYLLLTPPAKTQLSMSLRSGARVCQESGLVLRCFYQ
jgi:hypothetical protein